MKAGVIIQARTGSTRLPNKILLDFVNGERIIDILLQNLKKALPDIPVIVATTTSPNDIIFEEIAQRNGVLCFRGDEQDVLNRFIKAAEHFDIDTIIRVCSDNPLLQAESIQKLIEAYKNNPCDYVSFSFPDNLPVIKSHLGLYPELTTLQTLKKVQVMTSEKIYREHVTNYIYAHPEAFKINLLELPAFLQERKDIRFTVDTQLDFETMQKLYSLYHGELNGSLENLVNWIDVHPDIYEIMSKNIKENSK
ncbi:MAG: cytidylyltransferase domain-containing protein [Bacteroidales bacterium]